MSDVVVAFFFFFLALFMCFNHACYAASEKVCLAKLQWSTDKTQLLQTVAMTISQKVRIKIIAVKFFRSCFLFG